MNVKTKTLVLSRVLKKQTIVSQTDSRLTKLHIIEL